MAGLPTRTFTLVICLAAAVGCAPPITNESRDNEGAAMSTSTRPIVVEATYSVDAATVWKAITDPEQMSKWYFDTIETFEPEVGFETRFNVHVEGEDYLHVWRVTEVAPQQKIAYTFNFEGIQGEGLVAWELSDVAGGTKLTLTHSGIESYPTDNPLFQRDAGVAGWEYFLDSLKRFLEATKTPSD